VHHAGGALDPPVPVPGVARPPTLGGFGRLRDFGVPENELRGLAGEVVERPGARANPRPVTQDDAEELLREIW
jgi:alcohol dehydrogenase class IV